MTNDVIVIGGGLSGLSCAALLARGGAKVRLVEGARELGGLGRSTVRHGFVLNRGAHALYRGGAALEVLEALGIEPRGQTPPLVGQAFLDGAMHRLPSTPWSILTTSLLTMAGRVSVLRTFAGLGRIDPSKFAGMSARAWLEEHVADPRARLFMAAMFRLSTYVGDLDALGADGALSQLQSAARGGVLYLDGGWQTMVDALKTAATSAGVRIDVGVPVVSVESGCVHLRDGSRQSARHVVFATPPAVITKLRGLSPSKESAQAKVACLDVGLCGLPAGPGLAFDLDDPMYLSIHSNVAALAPEGGALVHVLHYRPPADPADARAALESMLDRTLPGWRPLRVTEQFLPGIVATHGVPLASTGLAGRPSVSIEDGLWRVGEWIGAQGMLADAAFASAREAARAILQTSMAAAA